MVCPTVLDFAPRSDWIHFLCHFSDLTDVGEDWRRSEATCCLVERDELLDQFWDSFRNPDCIACSTNDTCESLIMHGDVF
jgi:hypothetical protein